MHHSDKSRARFLYTLVRLPKSPVKFITPEPFCRIYASSSVPRDRSFRIRHGVGSFYACGWHGQPGGVVFIERKCFLLKSSGISYHLNEDSSYLSETWAIIRSPESRRGTGAERKSGVCRGDQPFGVVGSRVSRTWILPWALQNKTAPWFAATASVCAGKCPFFHPCGYPMCIMPAFSFKPRRVLQVAVWESRVSLPVEFGPP